MLKCPAIFKKTPHHNHLHHNPRQRQRRRLNLKKNEDLTNQNVCIWYLNSDNNDDDDDDMMAVMSLSAKTAIIDLKEKINERFGVTSNDQMLLYCGVILKDFESDGAAAVLPLSLFSDTTRSHTHEDTKEENEDEGGGDVEEDDEDDDEWSGKFPICLMNLKKIQDDNTTIPECTPLPGKNDDDSPQQASSDPSPKTITTTNNVTTTVTKKHDSNQKTTKSNDARMTTSSAPSDDLNNNDDTSRRNNDNRHHYHHRRTIRHHHPPSPTHPTFDWEVELRNISCERHVSLLREAGFTEVGSLALLQREDLSSFYTMSAMEKTLILKLAARCRGCDGETTTSSSSSSEDEMRMVVGETVAAAEEEMMGDEREANDVGGRNREWKRDESSWWLFTTVEDRVSSIMTKLKTQLANVEVWDGLLSRNDVATALRESINVDFVVDKSRWIDDIFRVSDALLMDDDRCCLVRDRKVWVRIVLEQVEMRLLEQEKLKIPSEFCTDDVVLLGNL